MLGLNTAGIARPALITELAEKFGSQAVVLQLDVKRVGNTWEAFCKGGREPTGRDAIEWAREAVDRGAGEILLTSIDHDGVCAGLDIEILERVSSAVPVPTVISGGFGAPLHAVEAWKAGAAGIAIASAFHFGRVTPSEVRDALREEGVPVRSV